MDVHHDRPVVHFSDGHRLFLAVPGSLAVIAKKLGVSKAVVGNWRTGQLPKDRMRVKLAESYGIPESAWTTAPSGAARTRGQAAAPIVPPEPGTELALEEMPTTNESSVSVLMRHAHAGMTNSRLQQSERAKWASEFSKALAMKIRIERDAELLEDRIVREHPRYRRAVQAIVEAVKPYPDAARAIAKALQDLGDA